MQSDKGEDDQVRYASYSDMIAELRFHIRQNNALILGASCLHGDYSRDMIENLQDRLKQGATNNSDAASKLRERVYNAFKLAGYEEDVDGDDTCITLSNRIDPMAPKIAFEYKYHAVCGRKKIPVICLKDVHRRMVEQEPQYYAFVANRIVATLEEFPDVFNCMYISLYVIPSLNNSKKLSLSHSRRMVDADKELSLCTFLYPKEKNRRTAVSSEERSSSKPTRYDERSSPTCLLSHPSK